MGLEIAEIMMDLEDEFCVELFDNELPLLKVSDIEDLVVGKRPRERISEAIALVPGDCPDGHLDHDTYCAYWKKHKSLPSPSRWFGLQRNQITSEEIIRSLTDRLARYQTDDQVRVAVRRIIAGRLSLPAVASHQDLIKDLGCG